MCRNVTAHLSLDEPEHTRQEVERVDVQDITPPRPAAREGKQKELMDSLCPRLAATSSLGRKPFQNEEFQPNLSVAKLQCQFGNAEFLVSEKSWVNQL